MSDHPRELLPLIAEGAVPDAGVRAHLESCRSCRLTVAALSPLDLDYAWDGVASELDAPRSAFIETVLERTGFEPNVARFVAATPSLRGSWVLASLTVVAAAVAASFVDARLTLSPVLVSAPLVSAALVAFAYGPAADRAYEVTAATPLSPLMALLLRLAAVLVWNSVLVGAADLAAGGDAGPLAWFLPMTGVALVAAAVALRTQPVVGTTVGMGLWMTLVLAATSLADDPASWLWGSTMQVVYGVTVVAALALLCRWVSAGRGFVAPVAFPQTARR